jgi:hypothetical protein
LLVERRKNGWARKKRRREPAHRELPGRFEEAYRAAHRLACQEWSVRQFSGLGRTSPGIVDAIAGGCELPEMRCRRCSHESLIDLTEGVWPRAKTGIKRDGPAGAAMLPASSAPSVPIFHIVQLVPQPPDGRFNPLKVRWGGRPGKILKH